MSVYFFLPQYAKITREALSLGSSTTLSAATGSRETKQVAEKFLLTAA
jgi:hypothetical protein